MPNCSILDGGLLASSLETFVGCPHEVVKDFRFVYRIKI